MKRLRLAAKLAALAVLAFTAGFLLRPLWPLAVALVGASLLARLLLHVGWTRIAAMGDPLEYGLPEPEEEPCT